GECGERGGARRHAEFDFHGAPCGIPRFAAVGGAPPPEANLAIKLAEMRKLGYCIVNLLA
ncbi:MAG: hypothetical protein WAT47_08380, partial [Nostocoides sp.]